MAALTLLRTASAATMLAAGVLWMLAVGYVMTRGISSWNKAWMGMALGYPLVLFYPLTAGACVAGFVELSRNDTLALPERWMLIGQVLSLFAPLFAVGIAQNATPDSAGLEFLLAFPAFAVSQGLCAAGFALAYYRSLSSPNSRCRS